MRKPNLMSRRLRIPAAPARATVPATLTRAARSFAVALTIVASLSAASVACRRAPPEEIRDRREAPAAPIAESQAPQAPLASAVAPAPGAPTAPLAFSDPPGWKRRPPSNAMRTAEYLVPRANGDSEDAECSVVTFGPGGGSVDQNIDRWIRQFDPSATSPLKKSATQVDGMKTTVLKMSGTYTGMGTAPKPNYALIGAVVEAPSGLWFFKLVGPDATVQAAAKGFEALLGSIRKPHELR